MKKVIRKSLVIAVMLTTMVGYANEFVNIDKKIDKTTNVSFNNVTEGSVLTIKDVNGIILYKETIKNKGNYSKEFNLTALPDGNYLFELDKEFEIKVMPFEVTQNEVLFDKENESMFFKPSIDIKNGTVKMQFSNLTSKPVNLEIYYTNGDLVYKAKYEKTQILHKAFDLSTSLKGGYTIYVKTGDRTFTEDIKI